MRLLLFDYMMFEICHVWVRWVKGCAQWIETEISFIGYNDKIYIEE